MFKSQEFLLTFVGEGRVSHKILNVRPLPLVLNLLSLQRDKLTTDII